jgi:hypothetical protein
LEFFFCDITLDCPLLTLCLYCHANLSISSKRLRQILRSVAIERKVVTLSSNAGGGGSELLKSGAFRTHGNRSKTPYVFNLLRDWILSPAPLAWLGYPCYTSDQCRERASVPRSPDFTGRAFLNTL